MNEPPLTADTVQYHVHENGRSFLPQYSYAETMNIHSLTHAKLFHYTCSMFLSVLSVIYFQILHNLHCMQDLITLGKRAIQEHKNSQACRNKTVQTIDKESLLWESIVKTKHGGPTSLAFMQLDPGDDRVVCHICIPRTEAKVLHFRSSERATGCSVTIDLIGKTGICYYNNLKKGFCL